jgi:uncharacterized membrane protein YfcA
VKEKMIGTKSVNSFFMQLTKIGTYAKFGALDRRLLLYGLMIGVCATTASWTGKQILRRIDARRFRMFVVAVMVLTGGWMLWEERGVLAKLWGSRDSQRRAFARYQGTAAPGQAR